MHAGLATSVSKKANKGFAFEKRKGILRNYYFIRFYFGYKNNKTRNQIKPLDILKYFEFYLK